MDSQTSPWLKDAAQLPSNSSTGLYDVNEFFDTEEIWNSLEDWIYPIEDGPNVHSDASAVQFPATQHDYDAVGMLQPWGKADTENPTSILDISRMPSEDQLHESFQYFGSPSAVQPDQNPASQYTETGKAVPAQECFPHYDTQAQYLAPLETTLQVHRWTPDAQFTTDCSIIHSSSQPSQFPLPLDSEYMQYSLAESIKASKDAANLISKPHRELFVDVTEKIPAVQGDVRPKINRLGSFIRRKLNSATVVRPIKNRQPRIPASAKRVLELQFFVNKYPTPAEIDALSVFTKEEPSRIKNWFSNARSRRPAAGM
jgi:hypothetical protein